MRTLALLLLLPSMALAAPSVRVAPRAEVPGAVVRLGDVARLSGFAPDAAARFATIELGRAPQVGTGQFLPRAFLISAIRDGGVPPGVKLEVPARLEVTRRGESLSGDKLRARVAAEIRAAMPHAAEDVAAVKVPALPDVRVPVGAKVDVRFEKGCDFAGPVAVELRVTDGADVVRTQRLTAQVDLYATVWAPTRAMRRGEAVTTADLEPRRVAAGEGPADALGASDSIDGATLRRDVKAGEALRRSWLELPPLVARGDRVTLVAKRGGVQLTVVGEALGRGTLGETVRVRNVASQKVVAGRVAGPQTVEILF